MIYPRECRIARASTEPHWDESLLDRESMSLDHTMGDAPEHRPVVRVRLRYDDSYLYAHFLVDDRYVTATAEKHQDPVCVDSCVELFFTPGPDAGEGYFNIECNCGGTVLLSHQLARGDTVRPVDLDVIEAMDVRHSLPARVSPEIPSAVRWTVSYRVPVELLRRYAPVVRPRPGALWRANVYKCADASSHPHWLTWSPVDRPRPDFHRKDYFGTLRFR